MDSRTIDPIAISQRNSSSKSEDQYLSLPDLYIRKYILSEKLLQLKKHYVPKSNIFTVTNLEIHRPIKNWGQVLSDIQSKQLDIQERKKWKIAVVFQLAKEAQEKQYQIQSEQEEIYNFHICISSYLAQQITRAFKVQIEEESDKQINTYITQMKNDAEPTWKDYQDQVRKVRELVQKDFTLAQSFEFLFNEANSLSEPITEVQDFKGKQADFDFTKKYQNLQEALLLFMQRDANMKQVFQKTQQQIDSFPQSFEQVRRIEPQRFTRDACLDQEYEDLIYKDRCLPQLVLQDGEKMMKKMKIFQTTPPAEGPMPQVLEIKDLFRYKYNYIEKNCFFLAQAGKMMPIEQTTFTNHQQQLTRQHPMLKYYFIEYLSMYNGDFAVISNALSGNMITGNQFQYNSKFCADLYAWLTYTGQIPSNTKFIYTHSYNSNDHKHAPLSPIALKQTEYNDIINNYEDLIFQSTAPKIQIPNHNFANQNVTQLESLLKKELETQGHKELSQQLRAELTNEITIDYSSTSQPVYALVSQLAMNQMSQLIQKQLPRVDFYIDRKYRSVEDYLKSDTQFIEQIKREMRRPRQNPNAGAPPQYSGRGVPPAYHPYRTIPPVMSGTHPPRSDMTMGNDMQIRYTPPPNAPRVEQQPPPQLQQPTQQQVTPVQPPTSAQKKKQSNAAANAPQTAQTAQPIQPQQPIQAPPQSAPAQTPVGRRKKNKDEEPVPIIAAQAPVEARPVTRRPKKSSKKDDGGSEQN